MENSPDKKSNPAIRVHKILLRATRMSDSETAGKVWSKVFDIPESDRVMLHRAQSDLLLQVDEIKAWASNNKGYSSDLYEDSLARVADAVTSIGYHTNWKNFKSKLSPTTLRDIKWLGANMPSDGAVIDDDELSDLMEVIHALQEDVINSEFTDELKALLIKSLEKMRYSIQFYRINGSEGLEEAVEQVFGIWKLYTVEHDIPDPESNSRWSDVLGRFWNAVAKLATLANITRGAAVLPDAIESISGYLPPG